MNPTPHVEQPPRRFFGRRRWLLLLAVFLLLGPLIYAVVEHLRWRDETAKELQAAVAELDAADSGWRFEDIVASRPVIPDEQNGAHVIAAVKKLLPTRVPSGAWDDSQRAPDGSWLEPLQLTFQKWPANVRLDDKLTFALRKEMQQVAPAIPEARKLVDFPEGRFDIFYPEVAHGANMDPIQDTRTVAWVLTHDATLRSHDGDMEGAVASLRAALNAGRSIGEEPSLMPYLARIASPQQTLMHLERLLAQGQIEDGALEDLQRRLEREEHDNVPALLAAMRGQRALDHRMIEGMEAGRVSVDDLSMGVLGGVNRIRAVPMYRYWHADYLRHMTAYIDAVGHPMPEWEERFPRNTQEIDEDDTGLAHMASPTALVLEATRHYQARLRCGITALAVERFRRANGRWPERLAELVPTYLAEPLADPYDGQPLRLRRLEDGVVVYSIGKDKQDNKGETNPADPFRDGTDLPFRLWDVGQRGLPPPAADKAPGPAHP